MMAAAVETTTNAQVRLRVLDDHRRIRAMLLQLDATRRELLASPPHAIESLRKAVRRLVAVFHHHLALEERILAPVIEHIDAWGPVRVERMKQEHHEQRAMLRAIAADMSSDRTPAELADEVRWLVEVLLADMAREEAELLAEDLLGDDPINTDEFGG